MGLSDTMLLISWGAMLIIMVVTWILTYLPYKINWHFWLQALLAAATVGFLGIVGLILKFICWLFGLIF